MEDRRWKRKDKIRQYPPFSTFFFYLLSSIFLLLISNSAFPALAAESFFVTIDKVELKSADGQWVTVIRPDRRLDLMQEEPVVRFFNNGRIAPGGYTNVRVDLTAEEGVSLKKVRLERSTDYLPPVAVKKGTFVSVALRFDWEAEKRISKNTIREVRLLAGEDERIDGGDTISIWF